MESLGSRSSESDACRRLLLLFLLLSIVFLILIQALTGLRYPIYIEGVEFFLDVPDSEFSTADIDSAIVMLEPHDFGACSDDTPHGTHCPHSLQVSPSDTPGLGIWLKTECENAV